MALFLFYNIDLRVGQFLIGFPGSSDGNESVCNAGDPGSIPGSGRFPGEGNHYPLSLPSILAWRIPWTEEPGGLQSMGLQKTWTLNT